MKPRGIPVKPTALNDNDDLGALDISPDRIFQDRFQ